MTFHSLITKLTLIVMLCIFAFPTTTTAHISLQSGEEACDLSGKVINVMDGDTLRVLGTENQQHKIRLAGIDTPEKKQAFGNIAKTYLSETVKGRMVCIKWNKRGQYGRIIGTIYADGEDINLDLIQQGLAWHYKKYQKDQSPQERTKYAKAETSARTNKLGLWQDGKAIAPWAWRKQKRELWKQKKLAAQDKKQAKKEAALSP